MKIKNSKEGDLSLLPQQFLHPTTSPKSAPSLSSSANSRALLPNGTAVVPQRRKKRKMSSSSSSWSLSSAAKITASSHTSLSNRLLSLNHFVISFSVLLFLLFSPSPASAAEFNIEKLQEYNSLVSLQSFTLTYHINLFFSFLPPSPQATCIGQIHKDFELCNTRGAEKAKSFNVNLGEEWNRRLQCCGMWKLRDCWMRAAQAKCSKAQAEQVFKLPQLFLPDLASSCTAYTPESGKCSIPMWLMASVVGAGLALLLCCFGGTCWCVRRLRARAVRRSALHRRHAPKQHGGGKGLGAVSTSLISSSSVVSASNGGNGLQVGLEVFWDVINQS